MFILPARPENGDMLHFHQFLWPLNRSQIRIES